jgi:hypothetical protein
MKNVSLILLGATLISTVACGNKSTSSNPATRSMLLTEEGKYQAALSPINAHVAGDVSGEAIIRVKGDNFAVEVKVNGSPAQIVHTQNIHVADECPTLASDVNKDGIIDGVEGLKSYGAAVIPLDNQLKTQLESDTLFPSADFSGNYYYRQNVSMMEMMTDLTKKDEDLKDSLIKLKSSLGIAGRQIVIYGVAADAALPESVASFTGQTKQASLPIACATFSKVASDDESSSGGKE